ncbi:unnamed protein product [Cladocopium goreaui]|uniref:Uncharacterized protein n=1 Tax=Cladocopium goreaui TaxID=2562237 RepID=A0A9P1CC32_9DINO|nr:unnamed protein product [Cladocopium goreaui]
MASWEEWQWRGRYEKDARWGGNKWTAYGEQERRGAGACEVSVVSFGIEEDPENDWKGVDVLRVAMARLLDLRFEILPIKKLCKFDFANKEDVEWDMPVGKSDGSLEDCTLGDIRKFDQAAHMLNGPSGEPKGITEEAHVPRFNFNEGLAEDNFSNFMICEFHASVQHGSTVTQTDTDCNVRVSRAALFRGKGGRGHVWPLKHGLPVRPQPVAPGVLGNGGNGSQVSQVGMDPAKNAHALPYLLEKQVYQWAEQVF